MRHDTATQSTRTFSATFSLQLRILIAGILLLILSFFPSRSTAHQFSFSECKEASDFIRNAALARDNGMVEAIFIDKVRDDIEIIRAFPPQLRWFVQDDEDAEFLRAAVADVFQDPRAARVHQVDFFRACMESAKATSNTKKISM